MILFKQARNKTLIRDAKSTHYKNDISNNKNNPKKLWKILKELGATKTNTMKPRNIGLTMKGDINFNKKEVANHFNTYFTSIAKQLVSNLQPSHGLFNIDRVKAYYNKLGAQPNSFSLRKVEVEEVEKKLLQIDCSKGPGLDGLSPRFLHDAAAQIAPYISHIFNLSVETGVFPNDLKRAKIVPLFKKGNSHDPGNYRPVSILGTVSKIFER